jgi:hypothetical protein
MKHIPSLPPQLTEIRTKGFRQLYLLDDTFSAGIFLLINPTTKEFDAWLMEHFGIEDKSHDDFNAFHNWYKTKDGSIYNVIVLCFDWTWKRSNWGTLVHEIHHAVTNILTRKGIKHSDETEEVWAYYQQSILERFIWGLGNRRLIMQKPKVKPPKKRPLAKKPRKK